MLPIRPTLKCPQQFVTVCLKCHNISRGYNAHGRTLNCCLSTKKLRDLIKGIDEYILYASDFINKDIIRKQSY